MYLYQMFTCNQVIILLLLVLVVLVLIIAILIIWMSRVRVLAHGSKWIPYQVTYASFIIGGKGLSLLPFYCVVSKSDQNILYRGAISNGVFKWLSDGVVEPYKNISSSGWWDETLVPTNVSETEPASKKLILKLENNNIVKVYNNNEEIIAHIDGTEFTKRYKIAILPNDILIKEVAL